jgi:MFS family permease
MDLTTKRWFRLSMFGMLYFVQGSALAYFRNFQKPYLDSFEVDPDVIGLLTSILLIPFILKIFIGMLSDRVSLFGKGHRKPYMAIGLILAALAFAAAAFVQPGQSLAAFAALIVLGSFSVTIFDSTADGLAIDITPHEEHGTVQGTMTGGRATGFIILSLAFGLLVAHNGYRPVFLIIGFCMLLPLFWVLRLKEPAQRAATQQFQWRAFAALAQPRFIIFGIYAIMYSIVSFGIDGLVTYFMSSDLFQASEQVIGSYGALRGAGAVLGALLAGILLDRIGRRISAFGAAILLSAGGVLIGLATGIPMLLVLGLVWGLMWGFQETVFVGLAMDLADTRIAASMFALMMALSNVGTAIGEGLATGLTDNMPFSAVFILLAGLNIINLPVLWGLFKIAPEIRLRQAAPPINE